MRGAIFFLLLFYLFLIAISKYFSIAFNLYVEKNVLQLYCKKARMFIVNRNIKQGYVHDKILSIDKIFIVNITREASLKAHFYFFEYLSYD